MHPDCLAIDGIVDAKGKSLRETAIISKNHVVDTRVQKEGVEYRKTVNPGNTSQVRIPDVRRRENPRSSPLGFIEDLDLHRSFSRSSLWPFPSLRAGLSHRRFADGADRESLYAIPETQSLLEIATSPPRVLPSQRAFL